MVAIGAESTVTNLSRRHAYLWSVREFTTDPAEALAGAPTEVRAVAEEVLAGLVRQ